jgi:Rrf2 family transcriptional regulator, nitric oxide-sensitive transcriptional repressor
LLPPYLFWIVLLKTSSLHPLPKNINMITQTAEYALRAMVYLADQGGPATTAEIAKKTQVPVGYLSKVMQLLSKSGLVHSQRGLHGGFVLVGLPGEISVLSVVNAVEPIQRFHECPLGLHGKLLCPLHKRLDEAALAVEECFGETTIAELNDVPRSRKPLCSFPLESKK